MQEETFLFLLKANNTNYSYEELEKIIKNPYDNMKDIMDASRFIDVITKVDKYPSSETKKKLEEFIDINLN